ncbi:uncharacterized protein ARMOST_21993 [Armillaria ostoyae]|uniref:Uncharacterized protein n=1 Tax=Armillaria ostoyae TaxID=47428 RepID=A0A284SBP7_ARMOS|nr:uncharacterized protein ARMOST_21993 [Armillaria ostoyae]
MTQRGGEAQGLNVVLIIENRRDDVAFQTSTAAFTVISVLLEAPAALNSDCVNASLQHDRLHRDISTKTTTVVVAVGFIMETQYPSSSRSEEMSRSDTGVIWTREGSSHPGGNVEPYRQHHDTNPANKALHTNVDTITVAEHYTASEKHFLRGDIYVWDSSIMAAIASGCRPGGSARSN